MEKAWEAVCRFFRRMDVYLFIFTHIHGEREKRPLFNLHIKRVYDGDLGIVGLAGFEMAIEHLHKAICVAKNIIREEVHVDEEGCIWPGYISGLPIRIAELDVTGQRGRLCCLSKAFMEDEQLMDQAFAPHIHVEPDELKGLPAQVHLVFFSGQRPYLADIFHEFLEKRGLALCFQRSLPEIAAE